MTQKTLIGPFKQILTMDNLPEKGAIKDDQLEIIQDGAVLMEDEKIVKILTKDEFEKERVQYKKRFGDKIYYPVTKDSILISVRYIHQ